MRLPAKTVAAVATGHGDASDYVVAGPHVGHVGSHSLDNTRAFVAKRQPTWPEWYRLPCTKTLALAVNGYRRMSFASARCSRSTLLQLPIATAICNKEAADNTVWDLILEDFDGVTAGPDDEEWGFAFFVLQKRMGSNGRKGGA